MSALILGSTGLVGNEILQQVNKANFIEKLVTVSRKRPQLTSDKLTAIVDNDSTKWPELIKKQQDLKIGFSAFGTTRSAAGSAENFVKIDHGVNYECAKAAKEAGVETYVLISSVGSNSKSSFLYLKTKGQLEEDIISLDFPKTIILRPGVLLGERQAAKNFGNNFAASIGGLARKFNLSLGMNPISGEEVAKAAIHLSQNAKDKVEIIEASDLLKLVKELK